MIVDIEEVAAPEAPVTTTTTPPTTIPQTHCTAWHHDVSEPEASCVELDSASTMALAKVEGAR